VLKLSRKDAKTQRKLCAFASLRDQKKRQSVAMNSKIIMNSKKTSQTLLLSLLIVNAISTILHYTDNFVFYEKYPQPTWITPDGIYLAWIVLTILGIFGYVFYARDAFWTAYLCLGIYSITGISSPAHYFYPAHHVFSQKMHFLIWTDAIAGISLLFFILWSALIAREWQEKNFKVES
jgi:hypothetical protein